MQASSFPRPSPHAGLQWECADECECKHTAGPISDTHCELSPRYELASVEAQLNECSDEVYVATRVLMLPLGLEPRLFRPMLHLHCEAATCSQVRVQGIGVFGRVDAQNRDELAFVEGRTRAAIMHTEQRAREATRRRYHVPSILIGSHLPVVFPTHLYLEEGVRAETVAKDGRK